MAHRLQPWHAAMLNKNRFSIHAFRWRLNLGHLLFRCSIIAGSLLSLVLLVETIKTYRYVERDLVREEAQRESDRDIRSIVRAGRALSSDDFALLRKPLEDIINEYPHQVAWIRVLTPDGRIVATTAATEQGPKYTPSELRGVASQRRIRDWQTNSGRMLLSLNSVRLQPRDHPEGTRGSRPSEFIEIAMYLNGVSVNFGPLRQDLVVGLSAAIALFVAVILIGLRFGEYLRARQVENELALARQVQFALFPAPGTVVENADFAAQCVPAREVGGDLYDVFTTEVGETVCVLGDVSGKGLPAALLMGVVEGAIRASCAGR